MVFAVAIWGDIVVVGAPGEDSRTSSDLSDIGAPNSGAVSIYCRQEDGSWLEQSILKASNRGKEDRFGESVAIYENTIVVGAPGEASASQVDPIDNFQ